MKVRLEDIELMLGTIRLEHGDLNLFYSQDCQIVASSDKSFMGRFFLPHSPKMDHVAFHGTNGTFKVGVVCYLHGTPVNVESLTHPQRCRFLLMLSTVLREVLFATAGLVSMVSTHNANHELGTTLMKEPEEDNIWMTLWNAIKDEESSHGHQAQVEP